jgi:fido (protein-threonine AMPylation protein)
VGPGPSAALGELRTAALGGHWAQVAALCAAITAAGSSERLLLDQLAYQAMLHAHAARVLGAPGRSSPGQPSPIASVADPGCRLMRAMQRNLAALDGDRAQAVALLRKDLPAGGSLSPEWASLPLSDVAELSRSRHDRLPVRVVGLARPSAGHGLTVGDTGSAAALTVVGTSERVARGTPVELVGRWDGASRIFECQSFGAPSQVPDYARVCATVEDLYTQAGIPAEPMQVRLVPSRELDQSVTEARAKRRLVERNAELAVAELFEAALSTSQLSLESLARAHQMIVGVSTVGAGKLRQTPAVIRWCGVITYRAPPVAAARSQASSYLRNLVDELQQGDSARHPAVLAAEAVVFLNKSHPFADGNGRVARALATSLLIRSGFQRRGEGTLGTFLDAHLDEYYSTLSDFDVSPWGWYQLFYDAVLTTFGRGPPTADQL